MAYAVLRFPAVKSRTGLSRTTIYNRISEGTFPSPIKLGSRAVGWLESDIDDYLAELVKQSRQGEKVG